MGGVKFKEHQIICSFIMYNINGNDNAAELFFKNPLVFFKWNQNHFFNR